MSKRLTSVDLQNFIDENGIQATLVTDIGDTPTVPAAAAALGVEPNRIIKTLLFLIQRPGEPQAPLKPVVVISNGESRVDKSRIAERFAVGKKRVKLASPEAVLELLGYPAGGVPPFGHRTELPVLMDASVADLAESQDGVVYGGGGNDHTMLELTVNELIRVTKPEIMPLS